jgi:AraC-like DNA-binding protein
LWITRYWKKNDMLPTMYQLEQNSVSILKRVFDFVKENYNNNITTYDAADYVNLSYSYFSRLFKQNMGIGFTDYLNSVRISEAERLLVKTEKSMTEIAMDTGFSTSSYFILKFRQKNNISPLAYRKRFGVKAKD